MKKTYFVIIILFLIIIFLTGCSNESNLLNEKISSELDYLEDAVFTVICKYCKGEYLDENDELKWDEIIKDEQKINNTIESIILDIDEMKIEEMDIFQLNNLFEKILLVSTEKNEKELIKALSDFYKVIPEYLEKNELLNNEVKDKYLKSKILEIFSYSINEKWEDANYEIENLNLEYEKLLQDEQYINDFKYKIKIVNIVLNEFSNSVKSKNFDLIKLRVVNCIEKI